LFDEEIGRWPPDLAQSRGWTLHELVFPVIDCEFSFSGRTPLRLYWDLTDWDDEPPSISLRSSSGELLTQLPQNLPGVFNNSAHPIKGSPFICMAGSREFHTHHSHLNEPWEQYRRKPGFGIGDILTKLWHAWLKGSG
jgi:hypothetical protein